MKHHLYIFLIVLFFLPSLACGTFTTNTVNGSGNLETQDFDVSNFDSVTLAGFGDVFVEQGKVESLSVQTDDNIMPLLEINVVGRELVLGMKRNVSVNPSKGITYNLTVKDLSKIALKGSGNFSVEPIESKGMALSLLGSGDINIKGLDSDSLTIDLSGSGNITVEDVAVKTIDTNVKGSGDIKLDGESNTQAISVSGSGNYLAGDLETVSADINIAGSGDLTVWAKDELKIHVSGSGDVRYYDNPTIDQSGGGSGNVSSLGEK